MGLAHIRTLILSLLLSAPTFAHEIGRTRVSVVFHRDHTWSADVIGTKNLDIDARFDGVKATTRAIPPHAKTFTWRNARACATYAITFANEGEAPVRQWIEGDATSKPFVLSQAVVLPTRLDVIRQYLILGFTHIVPHGFDHILFVLGLFLLSAKVKPVLTQVTSFTVAHSITLGLTIYGVVSVSPRIVEPAIALSIAYVAIENLTTQSLKPWRVAIVFAFGLLHGMGFAGVLKDLGLPRNQFVPALITFNVGVEAGQLAVIAAAWLMVVCWARTKPWYRHRFVMPASALIAATGILWTAQRVLS